MKKSIFEKCKYKSALLCVLLLVGTSANVFAQGKKYGLFVGINAYQPPAHALKGCVNDARNLRNLLTTRYRFADSDTTLLTDSQATRDGILNALKSYQSKVKAGDTFVFTYSGHGSLFPDSKSEDQDEDASLEMAGYYPLDKYDSAICPIDLKATTSGKPWNNLILDDELYAIFSGFTAKGAMVVFISDSCHSGSLARSLGGNLLPQPKVLLSGVTPRFLPLSDVRNLGSIPAPQSSRKIRRKNSDANGLLIVLSGSKDTEFSLDYPDSSSGESNGLFTATLLKDINALAGEGKTMTYSMVRDYVSTEVNQIAAIQENSQTPQIDARFFNGSLNTPLFEFPNKQNAQSQTEVQPPLPQPTPIPTTEGNLLRVVVKVVDEGGASVNGAAVGIFAQIVKSGEPVSPRTARALGRTNPKGLYDSNISSLLVPKGTYFMKVIADGYEPYIGEVKVEENQPGFCVLIAKLKKQ